MPAGAGLVARGGKAAARADDAIHLAKTAAHLDDGAKLASHADEAAELVGHVDEAVAAAREVVEALPEQIHHFATNKSSKWTDRMAEIAQKYGLDLDEAWNKERLPHRGRHPDAYHEWVLERMYEIDEIAQGDREVFLELFEQEVKRVVRERPEMLRKWFWRDIK